ncbi:MAG: lactonase family protein [Microlunatus sp.]|nr:lactonase family protein [Microlunatus sp.]MDN5770285.1 lactonase family protein [Microlunatus sp.]MDN5805505.1 lactonase family protein [Microlunatus sp.]
MSTTSALRHVFVGGYTSESDGQAAGVTSLLNQRSRGRIQLEPVSTMGLTSPTWLTRHPSLPVLLVVEEASPSTLSSLRYQPDGSLQLLGTVETGGDGACHVTVTDDGRYALVSHYGSGSVALVEIAATGTLSDVVDLLELTGAGPNAERQAGSHVHQVVAVDGGLYLVVDLGGDHIFRLRVMNGALVPIGDPIQLPPGWGPRHLVAVADHLVVAGELSGELWIARRDGNDWRHLRTVPSSSRTGLCQPSGIVTDGARVFVANRGVDTISVFDLDPAVGEFSAVAEFDCGGHWPRALTLDGGRLWVANEKSSTLSLFELSPLPPTAPAIQLDLPTPTCVVLVHDDALTVDR